ncbi:MAG TPA: prepilin peptidase [Nitrospiraceae bacterium]|nr:MAG: peptidase A24 [Nitrospirae bacterium GWA2_46_11]HAK88771.1 prepilin peptidase [Nitrospiraceae bacterium]HCZ12316.1 prepilin peptidase [Nitrospiraceae bacterium]
MSYIEPALFIFGLIVGSFLNVCIHRIPRGKSIVSPSSACPACNTPIKPWDNIPVLSYIILRGKCRKCGEGISIHYPTVELLNAALYWSVLNSFGIGWHLPVVLAFASAMVVITFIDLDFQVIPDVITLPGIIIGLISASFLLPDPFSLQPSALSLSIVGFKNSVTGLLLGGGLFYLIAVLSRGGMGGGDIKMMAMVGAFMGWKAVFLTTFIGSLTGSIVGISLMVFKGKGRKTKIPFGPFLALGSLITLFFGGEIIRWYFTF